MFNNWELVKSGSWQKDLERLQALRKEITEAGQEVPVMAEYLRKRYNQKVQEMAPGIQAGVIAEQRASIAAFVKAEEASRAAHDRELSRWDAEKFGSARSRVMERVEQIRASGSNFALGGGKDKIEKLKDLQAELMASSDLHVKRAAAEIFSEDLQGMHWDGNNKRGDPVAHNLGSLVVSAKNALPAIRRTPEQDTAQEGLQAAYNSLADAQERLVSVGRELNDDPTNLLGSSSLTKAYRAVRFDREGGVQIFADNSVEVSGVDWSAYREGVK